MVTFKCCGLDQNFFIFFSKEEKKKVSTNNNTSKRNEWISMIDNVRFESKMQLLSPKTITYLK